MGEGVTAVDYRSPCRMIWDLAGRPAPTDPASGAGVCAMCGDSGPLHAKLGPNFTDYRQLVHVNGTRLCVACSWTFGGKPPRTLRMWTIVARLDQPAPAVNLGEKAIPYVSGDYLLLTNRKDMRWVAATLAQPPADGSPWLVAVAESGQKHCAPFTPINHGTDRWTVRLDGTDITSTPDQWRHILSHSAALRHAGFSASAVETGQPPVVALEGDRLAVWCNHAPHLAAYVGTPLLHLANLMITKETVNDYRNTYPTN
jgi:hypothetical protein